MEQPNAVVVSPANAESAAILIAEDPARARVLRTALGLAVLLHLVFFATQWPALSGGITAAGNTEQQIFPVRIVRFVQPPPAQAVPRPPAREVPIPDATPNEPEPLREAPAEAVAIPDPQFISDTGIDIPAPPPAAPPSVLEVGRDLSPPLLTHRVEPRYTRPALAAHREGAVILELIIDEEGRPESVKVLRGLGLGLTESAKEAVRQWRWAPSVSNGRPVKVLYRLTVWFRIVR